MTVATVLDGSGAVLLVRGDAGVGKTRLLTEAAEVAEQAGVVVVVGRCLPLSAGLPLLPFMEVFRALSEMHLGLWTSVLESVSPQVRRDVNRLVPNGIVPAEAVEVPDASTAWGHARLFDGVRQVLRAMGRRRVAMMLDDVHWADPATGDLLEYLIGSSTDVPVPIVLTCRSREVLSEQTTDWMNRLLRRPTVTSLQVRPLDYSSALQHVRLFAGDEVARVDVASIVRRSEGNAFYAEQLVRSQLEGRPSHGHSVPSTLTSFLKARMRSVAGVAHEVLVAMAVAGEPVDEDLIVASCRRPVEEVRQALHELGRRYLLRAGRTEQEIHLAHALLGEAVLSEMLPGEHREWHSRIGSAMETRRASASAATVAEHFLRAGRPRDELRWRVQAARRADSLYAAVEAMAHWTRAVFLVDSLDPSDIDAVVDRVGLFLDSARAAQRSGDALAAERFAHRALATMSEHTDTRTRARALATVGEFTGIDDPDAARVILNEAVALYEGLPPEGAYLGAVYDLWCYSRADPDQTSLVKRVDLALEVGRLAGAPSMHQKLMMLRAWVELSDGRTDRAFQLVERAKALLAVDSDPFAAVRCAIWHTDILLKLGRLTEIPEVARDAGLAEWGTEDRVETEATSLLRGNVGQSLILMGEVGAAAEWVDPVTDQPPTRDTRVVHSCRATLDLLRGRLTAAEARWAQLVPAGHVDDDNEVEPNRADLYLWLGRPAVALEHVLTIVDDRPVFRDSRGTGRLLLMGARAVADVRVSPSSASSALTARSMSALKAAHAVMREDPFGLGPLRPTAKADVLMWRAEWTRAEGASDPALWESAADTYAGYPRPHLAAYARWRQAQALLDAGRRKHDLGPVLRRSSVEAAGHEPLLGVIRRLAERVHVDLRDPDIALQPVASNAFGLTDRELSVLRLVAHGDTNRQIGRRLFISDKTASVHVSNILRKLDVDNRLQAAVVADRAGLLPQDPERGSGSPPRTVSSSG